MKAVAERSCHRHWAQDLADRVSASQQGDGARESEQASGRQGRRADPDEGGPEEDCPDESRYRPWSQGGQSDPECLQKQRSREQSRMRPPRAQPCPQCGRRDCGQADDEPGTASQPTGRILFDGRDQECARDDVPDSLEGVAHEQHREPAVRTSR